MEFAAASAAAKLHSDKENLPPLSQKQFPPILKKPTIRRRWVRKPLADITNFFENTVRFDLVQDRLSSAESVCSSSNSRKRKVAANDEICCGTAKSLRMGFR